MKGIIFKPDMIKAIVEGRKTVTRRLSDLREINQESNRWDLAGWDGGYKAFVFYKRYPARGKLIIKPRYQADEIIYIKEAFWEDNGDIYFKSDFPNFPTGQPTNMFFEKGKWKSPLFLPEIFARYFIKITDIRPERLQEITPEDAVNEGAEYMPPADVRMERLTASQIVFAGYWDSINPKSKWETNPWCWCYEFNLQEKVD